MLFTAIPSPRNKTSSHDFDVQGAKTLSPAPVSDARIFAVKTPKLAIPAARWQHLTNFISATVSEDGLPIVDEGHIHRSNSFRRTCPGGDFIFKLPQTATTFKVVNPALIKQSSDLGYKKVHSGKFTFFEGAGEPDAIKSMINLGAEIYSYAPSERTSFGGNFAGHIIRRLLWTTFRITGFINEATVNCEVQDKVKVLTSVAQTFAHGTISDNASGHFLPYFSGLVLPDKSSIHTFLSIYASALGATSEIQAQTTILLTRGWMSLYNTEAGRIISHMVFCLNLAITGGFEIQPTFYKGDYSGVLLLGDAPLIYNTQVIQPRPAEDYTPMDDDMETVIGLKNEVKSMFGHEQALTSICVRLSAIPTRLGQSLQIDPEDVPTARHLHNLCKERKVPEEVRSQIIEDVKSLRFKTNLFDVFDENALLMVVQLMNGKEQADPHLVPFSFHTEALFTKSKTLSILAAYGATAPSPLPEAETNVSMTIKDGFLSKANLEGLPIYARPIQQAVEDWKTVKKTGSIAFRTKGKSKNGYQRVAGTNKLVNPVVGDVQTRIVKTFIELNHSKKRKLDVEGEVSEKTLEVNRRAQKKSRIAQTAEASNLFDTLGI